MNPHRFAVAAAMYDDATRKLYAAVFGTDSDSDISDQEDLGYRDTRPEWQSVEGVDGLWRSAQFLGHTEQESLLAAIENEGWFDEPGHNQAMRFGVLPAWADHLADSISDSVGRVGEFGLGRVLSRSPVFDQMIVNLYEAGEGIRAHVDLARFEDGIVVVSLLSSCVMRFRRCGGKVGEVVDVLLEPGDLVALSGDARYRWTHEISRERAEDQAWAGTVLEQARRISVTLRRLCPED